VQSAWKKTVEKKNWFGRYGAYVPLDVVNRLANANPDALALLNVLKAHNGPEAEFMICNGMAGTRINFEWRRLRNARSLLKAERIVRQIRPDRQHQPALYGGHKLQGHQSEELSSTNTPLFTPLPPFAFLCVASSPPPAKPTMARGNAANLNRGYIHRRRREGARQRAVRRLLIAMDGGPVTTRELVEYAWPSKTGGMGLLVRCSRPV
jgi:hypothetical protein